MVNIRLAWRPSIQSEQWIPCSWIHFYFFGNGGKTQICVLLGVGTTCLHGFIGDGKSDTSLSFLRTLADEMVIGATAVAELPFATSVCRVLLEPFAMVFFTFLNRTNVCTLL